MEREVYDTIAGIESQLTDLETFDLLIKARYEAGYLRREPLQEFVVLGRYSLDTMGNFGFIQNPVDGAPRVCTTEDFFALKLTDRCHVAIRGRPHVQQRCEYCFRRWTLDTYGDSVVVSGGYAHERCRHLALTCEEHKQFTRIFEIAGFKAVRFTPIANGYWPESIDSYLAYAGPWYDVETPWGVIQIGWRKRVISIDWSGTTARHEFPDEVTKSDTTIHAWTELDAMRYLSHIRSLLENEAWNTKGA